MVIHITKYYQNACLVNLITGIYTITLLASGSDPTCRVRFVAFRVKERIDREVLATERTCRNFAWCCVDTYANLLWCVVLACGACCQNENQTDEDIEARHYP